jgi:hypothetical protein
MSARHKYNAVRCELDGIKFASKRERDAYATLKLLERAGKISGLMLQFRYDLNAFGGKKVGEYRADFVFTENGQRKTIDVKGFMTPLSKWKIKHAELQYGMTVEIWR